MRCVLRNGTKQTGQRQAVVSFDVSNTMHAHDHIRQVVCGDCVCESSRPHLTVCFLSTQTVGPSPLDCTLPLPPTTHLRFTPRCVSFPSPATASFITFKGCVSGDQTILIPPAPTTINHPGSGPLQTDLILLEPIPHALNRSPLRARFTQCGGCHARCLCSDHPWLSPAALSSGGACENITFFKCA